MKIDSSKTIIKRGNVTVIWQWRPDYGLRSTDLSRYRLPASAQKYCTFYKSRSSSGTSICPRDPPTRWTGIYGVDCRRVHYYISPEQCHCPVSTTLCRTNSTPYPPVHASPIPGPSSTVQPRVFNGKRSLFPREFFQPNPAPLKFQPPRSADTPPRPNHSNS